MKSCLYNGIVTHHRLAPKLHQFSYRVTAWLIDLEELSQMSKHLIGFSHDRFNLIAFHDSDYGIGIDGNSADRTDVSKLGKYVNAILNREGVVKPSRIALLCYPRYLGYVFNPLSTYFCYDEQDNVIAIIYEVSNTFGDRHNYIIKVDSSTIENNDDNNGDNNNDNNKTQVIKQTAKKCFTVSPFNPECGQYEFNISPPKNNVAIAIKQSDQENNLVHASFKGKQVELQPFTALLEFIKMPFMTAKIVLAIHWEAARLWLKGLRPYSQSTISNKFVTTLKSFTATKN